jgi:hypothetical protein
MSAASYRRFARTRTRASLWMLGVMVPLLGAGCGQVEQMDTIPTGRSMPRPLALDASGRASLARLGAIASGQGRALARAEHRCRTARGRTRAYRDCSWSAYARYGASQRVNGSIARGLGAGLADGACRGSLTSLANAEALTADVTDELVAGLNSGHTWRILGPVAAGIGRMRTQLARAYGLRSLAVCIASTPVS